MATALCPGSFDPVKNGHLDIIGRAANLYDELVVAVFVNRSKSGLFTVDERIAMLEEVTADLPNVRVDTFRGLTVDYCWRLGGHAGLGQAGRHRTRCESVLRRGAWFDAGEQFRISPGNRRRHAAPRFDRNEHGGRRRDWCDRARTRRKHA